MTPPFVIHADEVPEEVGRYPAPFDAEALSAGRDLGRAAGSERLGVWRERLPPGRRTSRAHAHSREEEAVYVLSGAPVLRWAPLGGEFTETPLRAGSFVSFPAGTGIAHTVVNPGPGEVELLVLGERDPADRRCTVCRGDQTRIDPKRLGLAKLGGFSVCWAYAQQVEKALETIAKAGDFDLKAVVGYRPGRTRGAVVDGKRTQWSNHSFGTAIDLNAFANGLHASCNVSQATPATVTRCKLRIGGAWDPEGRPRLTVTAASSPYRAFAPFWKWGGEISGDIKDFMHFSISGY